MFCYHGGSDYRKRIWVALTRKVTNHPPPIMICGKSLEPFKKWLDPLHSQKPLMIHKSYLHESSGFKKKKKKERAARSAWLSTSPPNVSQEKPIKTHVIDERFMIELNRVALENFRVKSFMSTWRKVLQKKKKIRRPEAVKRRNSAPRNFFKSAAIMSALMKTIWIQPLDAVKLLAGHPSV